MKYSRPWRTILGVWLLAALVAGAVPACAAAQKPAPAATPKPAPAATPKKVKEPAADLALPTQLLLNKKYKQAIQLLHKLIPEHKDQAELQVMLAYALFRADKPADSLKAYTRAAQLRHPTAEDLKWVALDYVLLDDYTAAQKWMYQSLRMNPKDEQAWYAMGRIEYTRNLFKKARICFDQALKLKPHSVDAENNLGLTYQAMYHWKKAIAAYKQAIAWQQGAKYPSAQPFINLAIVYINQNHLDRALPMLQRAHAIVPHNKRVLTQLARANFRLGHLADAETELKEALKDSPKDAALHFQLGRVLSKEGKKAEAKAQFAQVAKLDGTHSDGP